MQRLDTRLDQIDHRKATLPELATLRELTGRAERMDAELVTARTAGQDLAGQVSKADADVRLVRDRLGRTQSRLDAGQGSAKDLQGMQHELTSLQRRQGELEDIELEVMERAEQIQQQVDTLSAQREQLRAQVDHATAGCEQILSGLERERGEVVVERAQVAAGVGEDLLALYEQIREHSGGLGAAPLQGRRCGGCQLELNQTDLTAIATAPADEVLRCEECRRILVRARQGADAAQS